MAKHIEVNLLFQSNTEATMRNLQSLGALLQKISTTTKISIDDGPLSRAVSSAQELQIHLQNAVNVNTGKIDLSRLNKDLKAAGKDLKTLTNDLQAVGPTGQQAFIKVATAIASAETPMIKVNKRLQEFGQTLINTAKWQIASTAIHGITGMLSDAVRHAEELNTALNDIQIVTGYGAATMSDFAAKASDAADALNTTTTEYAKAALIFYQQGLSGDEVMERANTVIKLAQVTGQSAQAVSDQMTAIWNNFYDGSHSLEYYADVLTALGAATAASTDEISDGLEKFAAVAKTVGLEYNTAAAAVATVVDKTRQSADVVGTAFKTVFARIQGLQLGETLEDGVDLNKYSEALEKVGVKVLDANGEMRQMDDILNDLGSKWEGLGETTQVAIAQTVGGVRQYNQMIALMDNWTSVQDNIELAENAGNELAKQARFWSTNYAAAAERVKQAKNELYESILEDTTLIQMQDIFAGLITGINEMIENLGGITPIVLALVGVFSKTLFPLVTNGFKQLGNVFSVWTGKAGAQISSMQAQMQEQMQETLANSKLNGSIKQQIMLSNELLGLKRQLTASSKNMTITQKEEAESHMQVYEALVAEAQQLLAQQALKEQAVNDAKNALNASTARSTRKNMVATGISADGSEEDKENVSIALSTPQAATKKEIEAIEERARTAQARANEKREEMRRLEQSIASHEAELAKKRAMNAGQGDSSADGERRKAILEEEYAQLEKLESELEEIGVDETDRLKRLQKILEIQEQIAGSQEKEATTISVGTATTSEFSANANESGAEDNAYSSAMASSFLGDAGVTFTPDSASIEASVASIEKLFTALGNCNIALTDIDAKATEFNLVLTELSATVDASGMGYDALSTKAQPVITALQTLSKAEENTAAAQKALTQAQKKYGKDSKEAQKAAKDLAAAIKAQEKASKAYNKILKSSDKTTQKFAKSVKQLAKSKKDFQAFAESVGLPKEEIEKVTKAFEEFEATGSPQAAEVINNAFSSMRTATVNAQNGINGLVGEIREMLIAAGIAPEKIDEVIASLREVSNTAPQVQSALEGVGNKATDMQTKLSVSASGIATFATAAAKSAGMTLMLTTAVTSLFSTFSDENATAMERFAAILTAITVIAPLVASGFKAIALAKAADYDATKASMGVQILHNVIMAASKAWTEALAKAEGKATIVKYAYAAATTIAAGAMAIFKAVQQMGWVGVAVGLAAVAALAVGMAVFTANTNKATEATLAQNEADMEAAEAANDLSEKWAEQQDSMDGLIKKYKDLKDAGEDYQETVDEIVDSVPDLIKAYHDAAKGLDIATGEGSDFAELEQRLKNAAAAGDVEAIDEIQSAMDVLISPEAAEAAQKGYVAAVNTLGTTLTETQGSISGNKYTVHVGGADSWFDAGNEEDDSVDILHRIMGSKATDSGNGSDITLDMSTQDQFMTDYEKLMEARDAIASELDAEALSESDTYREIDELLSNSKEQYEKAKEMQAEANKYGVYDAKANLEKQGLDITEIDSLEEYAKYRDALLNDENVKGDPEAEAVARQWLEANANVQEYVKAEQKIGYVRDNGGDADALTELYDTLDPEQKALFLEVDFTTFSTADGVLAEIERMQAVADQEEIQVKLEAISTAKGALKETGMTDADYDAIRNSGIEWGANGIESFDSFLNKSYQEQLETLEQLEEQEKKNALAAAERLVTTLQESLAQASLNSEEREALQAQLKAAQDVYALKKKTYAEEQRTKAIEELGLEVSAVNELAESLRDMTDMSYQEATATAAAYLLLADSLGITTDEVQKYLSTLHSGLGLSGEFGVQALQNLGAAAEEFGVELDDLINISENLKDDFSLTGASAIDMAVQFAEASSLYGISMDELEVQTQQMSKEYDIGAQAAARLAIQNQRMNKGLATLAENWTSWSKEIRADNKTTTDYAKAAAGLTDTIKDLVGATGDLELPDDFFESEKNLQLIEEAANGSTDAINRLGLITAQAALDTLDAVANTHTVVDELGNTSSWALTAEQFLNTKNVISEGIESLQSQLNSLEPSDGIEGMGEDWIKAMNDMALATNMSVEEMNSMLNQMGVSANVTTVEVEQQMQVPKYETIEQVEDITEGDGPTTYKKTSSTKQIGTETVTGTIPVASISTDGDPKTPDVKFIGNGSAAKSSTSSGGGSTTKPKGADKKKDSKERYMQIDAKMDDVAKASADTNREMETLYGSGRIAKMSQINKLLGDEVKLLEAKTAEAKDYLEEDKKAMEAAFKDAGVKNLEFDANGNITNIESALDAMDSEYNSMVNTYNGMIESFWSDGVISASEQEQLDNYKELMDEKAGLIDKARGAYDQYADTLNVIAETEDQTLEKQNEIRANNFQRMTDNLNLALEGTSAKTQEIDYYLNKIGDDFYKTAEAAALTGQKMDVATEVLALQKQHADGLAAAYEKGNITQPDYVAGLQKSRDAIYGELESLQSLDKEMQEYYGNTLDAAGEELGKYTERMDHLNSVLDHYQSLLTVIGKETDYKSMGVVLQGIADGAENSLEVAKAEYAFYAGEAEKKKALMESVPKDSAAFEQYKKEWEAAEAKSREAQDNMLSATAEWAEFMKAVIENELSDFAKTLEQQLTGGTSFDEMTTSIERAASLQEDYLTTTNKIYETTKMMRVAEKALDETTSTAAKNKLKGFIETTKQLQGQEKLSQFELDMQQKKYDLLLAEIALEEAQNAKSTVRLQRDAEGNFGYVYTADSNQVADAEQKVADAENALYNKGLEGANDYAQKYQSTMSEMYDTMTELQNAYLSGEITSQEEYDRRMLEAKDYYYQQLTNYSELYNVALGANTAIAQEAWSTEFAPMTGSTEQWMAKVDEYTNNCGTSFQKWQGVVSEVQGVVGGNFDELATKVTAITNESNALVEAITKDGGVIDKLGDEVTEVSNTTKAYAEKRDTILEVIAAYEAYLKTINGKISQNSGTATVGDTTDNVPSGTPSGFDTGGYTGEWGPTGKLAVLHQKEIVLNAEDTENLLQTVGMVRTILQTIDMHSMSAQIGGILSTPGFNGGESGSLEQNVKIEASFPNVQDRNEIEEAFNNLINRASQYANRG